MGRKYLELTEVVGDYRHDEPKETFPGSEEEVRPYGVLVRPPPLVGHPLADPPALDKSDDGPKSDTYKERGIKKRMHGSEWR